LKPNIDLVMVVLNLTAG